MRGVIFGNGKYGLALKKGLEKYYGVDILAICDNNPQYYGEMVGNVKVIAPNQLNEYEYDKIFICMKHGNLFRSVEKQLTDMEIVKEKICIMQMSREFQDAFIELDPVRKNWIRHFAKYTREIGLTGSVAECGVYRGETSMFINKYWKDRKLFLFDTFEGFNENDISDECNNFEAFENGLHKDNPFKNETPELLIENVRMRMLYPENVNIYKGYFPDSAVDIWIQV